MLDTRNESAWDGSLLLRCNILMCTTAPTLQCGYGCFKCAMSTEGGKPRCLRCVAGLTLVGGRCQLVKNYNAYCLYDDKRCAGCRQPYVFINGTCVPSGIPNCRAVTTVNNQAKCLGCSPGGQWPGHGTGWEPGRGAPAV